MKLTTEQFWEAMCDISFVRIDLYTGKLKGEIVQTDDPPEEVPTFMQSKVDHIRDLLTCADQQKMLLAAKYKRGAIVLFLVWVASGLMIILSRLF